MLSFLVLITAAYGVGAYSLGRVEMHGRTETSVLRLAVGLSLCALVGLVLGAAGLVWAESLFALLALATVIRGIRSKGSQWPLAPRHPSLDVVEWLCLVSLTATLVLALLGALAPQTHPVALSEDLATAAELARSGVLRPFMTSGEGLPLSVSQVLYAIVFHGGGESGTAMLSWTFAALACATLYALGARLAERRCGLAAAAILATAPVFGDLAGVVSAHLLLVGMGMAALLALLAARQTGQLRWTALCGFLGGSACGVSQTGLLTVGLLCVGTLFLVPRRKFASAGLCLVVAVVCAAPWMLNRSIVGAALFPDWITACHALLEPLALLRYSWDILMRPAMSGGWQQSPGALVLALGIPGLLVCGRSAWALASYAAAGGLALYTSGPEVRDFLPFLTPMMLVASLAIARLHRMRHVVTTALILAFLLGTGLHAAAVWEKLPVVLGRESREAYLLRRVPGYGGIRLLNEQLGRLGEGAVLSSLPNLYHFNKHLRHNRAALARIRNWPPDRQLRWLKARDFRFWVHVSEPNLEHDSDLVRMFSLWQRNMHSFRLQLRTTYAVDGGEGVAEIYAIHYGDEAGPPPRRLDASPL